MVLRFQPRPPTASRPPPDRRPASTEKEARAHRDRRDSAAEAVRAGQHPSRACRTQDTTSPEPCGRSGRSGRAGSPLQQVQRPGSDRCSPSPPTPHATAGAATWRRASSQLRSRRAPPASRTHRGEPCLASTTPLAGRPPTPEIVKTRHRPRPGIRWHSKPVPNRSTRWATLDWLQLCGANAARCLRRVDRLSRDRGWEDQPTWSRTTPKSPAQAVRSAGSTS